MLDVPMVLLIDSLDQLSNKHLARSDISFLKEARVHPDSIIIVSCLPDDKATYFYGCDTKLQQSNIPRVDVPLMNTFDVKFIGELFWFCVFHLLQPHD